jgi:transcriptional regulator with XRE-family HTH domain
MKADEIYSDLGLRIRRFRKEAGQTQAQLAAQIGISRASLANIEAGRQHVLIHHLYAIAEAVDLESLTSLLPPLGAAKRNSAASELPIAGEGLTDKQRRDVLRLMSGVIENNNASKGREE